MSAAPSAALYNPVHDAVFNVLSKQVAIDQDTQKKGTRRIPASSNGSGEEGTLSRLNGKRTEFNFSNGSNYKMRWDTTRLNVGVKFLQDDTTKATAVGVAPSWNLLSKLIRQITLNFNGHGTAIYNKSSAGDFKACFTSRLLRHYTLEELEKMSSFLFTPVAGDKMYLREMPNSGLYDNGCDVVQSSTAGTYIKFDATGGASVATSGALAVFKGVALSAGAEERARRYIGSDSHLRTHVLSVPFCDLFPRFQGVPKNLRSVQMSIEWESDTDILENAGASSTGVVHIVSCEIVTDDHILSTGQSMATLNEKMAAEPDNICFIDTDIMTYQWSGADIIKPSVRNLQDVMIMQFADDVTTAVGTSGGRYQSCGQLLLANGQTLSGSGRRVSSQEINSNYADVPSSVQIEYGDVQYPNSPINMLNGHHFDSSAIYYEYLKALGKVADRMNGSPLPRDLFASTMPFIWLRPFANDAVKLSDAKDLIIKMSGSSSSVSSSLKTGDIKVIIFQLKCFRIAVDGTVSTPTS